MPPFRLVLLFAALLAFHCAGNWALPLIDRDEPRFAEASREMLQRGDFTVPYFNGRERFDKPPLIYWAQSGAYAVFGESEFAARLPSAVFAALTALVVALWGARAFPVAQASSLCGGSADAPGGSRIAEPRDPVTPHRLEACATVGVRAALIFSLSLQTVVHARAAVADMPMVCFVALAAWCGWEWMEGEARSNQSSVIRTKAATRFLQPTTAYWLLAFLAMALGFLAKGPVALLPLGMLAWAAFQKPRESRPPAWQWAAGLALMLGVVALWGVPALVRTDGEFARVGLGRHVLARSFAPMEGHGAGGGAGYLATLPFYFLTVWASFFPWAVWLPAAARHFWRRRPARDSAAAFLLCGVALTFAVFTVVRTKLPHYTLPAFPFMALLLAKWWGDAARPASAFRRTAVVTCCAVLALALAGFPLAARFFLSEQIYRAASPFLKREMPCAMSGYEEPSLVWAFRRKLDAFLTPVAGGEVAAWMARPGPRLCVMPEEDAEKFLPLRDPDWKTVRAEGLQLAKGHRVRLCAVIKPL